MPFLGCHPSSMGVQREAGGHPTPERICVAVGGGGGAEGSLHPPRKSFKGVQPTVLGDIWGAPRTFGGCEHLE